MKYSPRNLQLHLIRWYAIVAALLFSLTAGASELNFNHLNINNGLSDNTIRDIYQDYDGFLWMGTSHGLNRYDGNGFVSFFSSNKSNNLLSGNFVNAIAQDRDSNLWVGTNKGLDVIDLKTRTIISEFNIDKFPDLKSNQINCLYLDHHNQMWIGTDKSVAIYNVNSHSLDTISSDVLTHNDMPTQFAEDSGGDIWMATSNGLYRYHQETKQLEVFRNTNQDPALQINNITALHQNGDKLWVGSNGGLFYAVNTTKAIHLDSISPIALDREVKVPIQTISSSRNQIWLGTLGQGLHIYDTSTNTIEGYYHNPNIKDAISWDAILKLYRDNNGSMWMGTYGRGCDVWHPTLKKFQSYKSTDKNSIDIESITSISSDINDNVWISGYGPKNEINIIAPDGTIEHLKMKRKLHLNVMALDNKSNGRYLWACMVDKNRQLVKFDTNTRNIIEEITLTDAVIKPIDIIDDTFNDILWICTDEDFFSYNKKTREVTYFKNLQPQLNSPNPIKIYKIIPDSHDILWLGTNIGLVKYIVSIQHAEIINSPDISDDFRILDMIDNDDFLWMATTDGLCTFDPLKNQFKFLGEDNELLQGITLSIEIDEYGQIWLGTYNGLLRYNPAKQEVTQYTIHDGLQSNDFSQGVSHKDNNGHLYFGGTEGFNTITPSRLPFNDLAPPVKITKLLINNEEVNFNLKSGEVQKLSQPIEYCRSIELDKEDHVIAFQFAALNYIQSSLNQYAYKLEGFEDGWNYIGNRNFITFTNLPPGTYTLRVKASNNDGIWNESGTSLTITITPPFYQTVWFKSLSIAALVSIVLLFYLIRINLLKRNEARLLELVKNRTASLHSAYEKLEAQKEEITAQKNLLEQKNKEIITKNETLESHRNNLENLVTLRTKELEAAKDKAEESDKLKTAFLANMSHEIRTPMNAIIGFSNLLKQSDFTPKEKESFIEIIQTNGETLLHLIDEIIDLAKIEAGQVTLSIEEFDLRTLFNELTDTFKHEIDRQNKSDLQLNLIPDEQLIRPIKSDQLRIKQVVSNLLNNAIKYTDQGKIELGYELKASMINIFVKDTGIGIPVDKFDYIFQRFNKDNSGMHLYGGAGLGLSISKQIIESLGGRIRVESEVGKGSLFSFSIPL